MNKKTLLLSSLVPLLLVGAYFLFFHTPTPRVLVFSKTEGYRHASIEPGIEAIRRLGAEHGFEVEATEDAALFNQRDLARFNAVVFLSTTGDILDDAQQIAFARFIQAGGGFVGIHAASDTEYGWPWYGRLIGGYFTSHPGNPNVREGTLHVADASHPSTEHLPDPWVRTDEWYDFRDRNPDVHVLLNIDETTYKRADEHPAPAPRPIAWYHEFDGGRAWYTALGHTAESFAEPLFLEHLLGGIEWAIGDGKPVDFGAETVMPEENRFTKTVMDQNLNEPMELDFLDPDRIIFVERKGAIKIHDLQAGRTETIATLDVFTGEEEGLLGVAVDPNYAENHWIYLSYSHPVDSLINLSRFVLEGNVLDRASEKVLLSVPVQRHQCCHVGGSVEFDGQGNLFFSIGDNTNPFASDGYAPIDERQGPRVCKDNDDTRNCNRSPWDAQKSSANTQDLRGKILRITPQPDGTYTIPEGNLFSDPAEGRPEIYVMGNRNPFRLAIDRHTGYLYWGRSGRMPGMTTRCADRKATTRSTRRARPASSAGPTSSGTTSPTATTTSPRARAARPSTRCGPSTTRPTTPAPACCRPPSRRSSGIPTAPRPSFRSSAAAAATPWPGLSTTTTTTPPLTSNSPATTTASCSSTTGSGTGLPW
ncbi:hypothetical protein AWN76_010945 [Rhodothermaceae bacterium RA]|nr:hypothetical protein AWN76_010945 [Rhodothermaceae bacterium RA]